MSSNASTSTPTSTMEIPGPSKLVRSVADKLPILEDPAPDPPKLVRSNAGDGKAVEWSDSEDEDEQKIPEKQQKIKNGKKTHKKENTFFFQRSVQFFY